MAGNNNSAELAAFEQHLDVYGSRADRWPREARSRFETLLAQDARARELLVEARAFEKLLDRAPVVDDASANALADRIAALATSQPQPRPDASIIDLASRRRPSSPVQAFRWKVASALAASLLVGIFIGAASPVVSAVEDFAGSVGLSDSGSSDLALFDDGAADDEELL